MGRFVATGAIAIVLLVGTADNVAFAADDELALDLGSATDKPGDAGTGLRKLELRRIAKGTFSEGAPASDLYREPDEVQRNVTLSKPFWMGKYPVTRAQFARFVSETRFQTDAEKGQSGGFGWDGIRLKQAKEYTWRNPGFVQSEDDPVTLVTFGDANAFTAWASRKTGRRVRLPTEAEFEYAARGGTTTPWYAAKTEDEASQVVGWFRPPPGAAVGTHPVGRKKANPFGLFDMSGNVNQWVLDVYAPWTGADAIDPANTTNVSTVEPERRVLRGGSWMRDPRKGRSAARYRNTPGTRNADNGFRVVVEDEATPPPATTAAAPAPSSSSAVATPPEVPSAAPAPLQIAPPVVIRQSTESVGWGFFAWPVGAVGFVVAWMLARRKKAPAVSVAPPAPIAHVPTPAKIEPYRPLVPASEPVIRPSVAINPRSPWPSDHVKSAAAIGAMSEHTPSVPPAIPSGPPPLSSARMLPSVPPAIPSGPPPPPMISTPPAPLVSGPPAPLPSSERALMSTPPAPLVSGPPPPPLMSTPPAPLVSGPPPPPLMSTPPAPLVSGPPPPPLMSTPPPPLVSGPPPPPLVSGPPPPLVSGPPPPLPSMKPPPQVTGPLPPPLPSSERSLTSAPPPSERVFSKPPPTPPAPLVTGPLPPPLPSVTGPLPPPLPSSERLLVSGPPPPPSERSFSRPPPALPSERSLPFSKPPSSPRVSGPPPPEPATIPSGPPPPPPPSKPS